MKLDRVFEALENRSSRFWTVVGVILVGLLGIIDYLTGSLINFSLFYLAPIILVTWLVNPGAGLAISFLSALTWLVAQSAGGRASAYPIVYVSNMLIQGILFAIVSRLVAELKKTQRKEQLAARTDFVTGVINRRYFQELLQMEIERIRRYPHPITVVYMDIDNFKLVNDLFGHKMGDEVLRSIATELKSQLRKTDIIARLGGDEFGLLLPSARLPEAEIVITKVRANLMEVMRRRNWPMTFSMGVVVCLAPPYSADQLIDKADELMYEVKNDTKNDVRFITWDGKSFRRP
ncbi:MAG TPA: diguanylate cyclase [Anaerolineales bacterium]|nr:diguanylate cyclase [Anaerolineales bacterium]